MRTAPAQLLAALRAFLVLTALLGLAYPLVVLGIGQAAFSGNADGSTVRADGRVVGSDLLGQSFSDPATGDPLPQWFQPRPSNAGDGYDPTSTAASNLGPESTELLADVCARSTAVGEADGVSGGRPSCSPGPVQVPPDAVTASASGLDPHISPAYARLQVERVARTRGLDPARVRAVVEDHVQGRTLGFLGAPRVNVLELNLALARLS